MHGNSLVHTPGNGTQPGHKAPPSNGNVFKPIPTLYYLIRNNPKGVYHFLHDHKIGVGKNNTALYNGVKNYIKHANQQEVLEFIQTLHPDKKYFNSPATEPSNSDLDAKIVAWETEKKATTDPDVRRILDDLIAKAKDLAQKGKGTIEELIGEFKGAKKDSDFYKQVSIIAIVVIVLLIITRK